MHFQPILMILFLLLISNSANAQRKFRFPFQVLYANHAYIDEFGTAVKQFGTLEHNQRIYLKAGHLILVDYHGKFYEFQEVDVVDLKEIPINIELEENAPYPVRPDIKPLFSTFNRFLDMFEHSKALVSHPPPIDFNFVGHMSSIKVSDSVPVKLSWFTEDFVETSGKFLLTVSDLFDDLLDTFDTDTSFIALDLNKLNNELATYVIQVRDKQFESVSSPYLVIIIDNESVNYKNSFFEEPKTAIEALQFGFELERLGNRKLAMSFYQKASSLSKKDIYQTLLNYFIVRANDGK